jgi:seryl-tRNA synthetase
MISLQHLIQNPDLYTAELQRRGLNYPDLVNQIVDTYNTWKTNQQQLDNLRSQKNDFNKKVTNLSGTEKQEAIAGMKNLAESVKGLESETRELREALDEMIKKIPNLTSDKTPIGKSDEDNPVTEMWGDKPEYDFEPKPYWELPWYQDYVAQKEGAEAMGARGFYLRGDIAWFQKVLFDYALKIVRKHGLELFYVPLMLNDKVLTGTGHLPDFDGQQYEVQINDSTNYYLIGSSEPSIMGYYMNKDMGSLDKPELLTCWSSCFRKESGSYGKDQQGILRVHQFEKIEMVAICKPEEAEDLFIKFGKIEEEIYSSLGLHFRAVEVCTGDMPPKHHRQVDYEAWFPGVEKYREICSNGNASDYQNRGLNISYQKDGKKEIPWGLNCTAVTFRSGLAILEQFQQADGRVKLPEVLVEDFGKEFIG